MKTTPPPHFPRYRLTLVLLVLVASLQAPAHARPDSRILAAARSCEPQARELLQQLVQIESGTGDADGLASMADILKSQLTALGADVRAVPPTAPALGDNLLATITGTGKGRILLIAHMDTVFPRGTVAQRPYRVSGDQGIGPGAGDDKSGIAAAVCALRILRDVHYRDFAQITLLLNSNEETGSAGSRELIISQSKASHAVINLERGVPPDSAVVARKGSAVITMEVSGRAAHAGLEPEKGRNAIVEAAHQVAQLSALADPVQQTSVNVTMIQGGSAMNVIPDRATIKADVRAFSAEEFDRVERGAVEFASRPTVPDVQVRVSMKRSFPPWPRAASTDALLSRAQKVYAEIGRPLTGVTVGSSSDVSLAGATGTPSIDGMGLIGGDAHSVDDHAELSSIVPRVYLLARLLMDLGRDPPRR